MPGESSRPNAGEQRGSDRNQADSEEPSVGEDARLFAAGLAQKLRKANVNCEIVHLVPAGTATLRRDRIFVVLALTVLTGLAWSYLLWLSIDMAMGGMDMAGYRMIPSGISLMMPADMPWRPIEFTLVFAMWTVMMVAMMTPSAVPMILMYARVGRQTETQSTPLAATVWFVAGYFLVWVAFGLLATMVQWALERTTLLDPAMASTSNILGALVFVVAGSYQWTRLKDLCLTKCQRPFAFLVREGIFRPDAPGSLTLGLRLAHIASAAVGH